jgi:tetratricopeptide (TPR) repeat protein
LAQEIALSNSYISLIEAGKRTPSSEVVARIAKGLGSTPDYLVTGRGGDDFEQLDLELRFAELALRAGDVQAARDHYSDILGKAMQVGYQEATDEARWGLCRAHELLGDLEAAIEGLEQLARQDLVHGSVSRTAVLKGLCRTHLETGDLTRAVEVGEAALRSLRADDALDNDEAVELASTLVGCYYERGDLTSAHLLARQLIERAERSGSTRARAAAYWNAALVAEARGNLRIAHSYTERALALYSETDNARNIVLVRMNCAWLLLRIAEPDYEKAAQLLERSLVELAGVGSPVDFATAETELARCRLLAGNPAAAIELATAALDRLSSGHRLEAARARTVLGHAQLAAGRVEEATQSYILATRQLTEAGASRHAASVWREVADSIATLGLTSEAMDAYRRTIEAVGVPSAPSTKPRASTATKRRRPQQ